MGLKNQISILRYVCLLPARLLPSGKLKVIIPLWYMSWIFLMCLKIPDILMLYNTRYFLSTWTMILKNVSNGLQTMTFIVMNCSAPARIKLVNDIHEFCAKTDDMFGLNWSVRRLFSTKAVFGIVIGAIYVVAMVSGVMSLLYYPILDVNAIVGWFAYYIVIYNCFAFEFSITTPIIWIVMRIRKIDERLRLLGGYQFHDADSVRKSLWALRQSKLLAIKLIKACGNAVVADVYFTIFLDAHRIFLCVYFIEHEAHIACVANIFWIVATMLNSLWQLHPFQELCDQWLKTLKTLRCVKIAQKSSASKNNRSDIYSLERAIYILELKPLQFHYNSLTINSTANIIIVKSALNLSILFLQIYYKLI